MFITITSQAQPITPDYTPQYIGIIGTVIGTVLGWFLSYITSNSGKLKISIEKNIFSQSENMEFAYLIKLFIFNESFKSKHMRNIKIRFYRKRKIVLESTPRNKDNGFNLVGILSEKELEMISVEPFEVQSKVLCNILTAAETQQLSQADTIFLFYQNEKNKTKKIKLKSKFSLGEVSMYKDGVSFI